LLTLEAAGVTEYAELGPGGVLTGMAKRTVDAARTISIATPDELDKLIDFVSAGKHAPSPVHEGEHLFATERLVVVSAAGVFTPGDGLTPGERLDVGTVVGNISGSEVRSAFAGVFQAFIAVDGERITARQPIAWLRTV
jgi:[acyl-carrier-protein] S-malonyltransferase